jgi:hypothetical protein
LIGTVVLTIITLVRCRHHWQFLLIGIFKLSESVLNGASGVYVSAVLKMHKKSEATQLYDVESRAELRISTMDGGHRSSSQDAIGSGDHLDEKLLRVMQFIYICEPFRSNVGQVLIIPIGTLGAVMGYTGLLSFIMHKWNH